MWTFSRRIDGRGRGQHGFRALLVLLGIAIAEPRSRASPRAAGLLAVLAAGFGWATVLAFKIGFSRPDAQIIQGVQGRYWIVPYVLFYLAAVLATPLPRALAAGLAPCLLIWLAEDAHLILAALQGYAANWDRASGRHRSAAPLRNSIAM